MEEAARENARVLKDPAPFVVFETFGSGCPGSLGVPTLAAALWRGGHVSRGVFYLGARVAGGAGSPPLAGTFATLGEAVPIVIDSAVRVGPDLRVEFTPGGS